MKKQFDYFITEWFVKTDILMSKKLNNESYSPQEKQGRRGERG